MQVLAHVEPVSPRLSLSHFEPIKLIGRGGFSRVIEVRKRDTGCLYAVKAMSKEFLIGEEKVQQIRNEREILARTSHPFIVTLHWAFQTVCAT